ncbi:AI-2E family transporter [Aquabacterium sp.]|uniref:AI-2E family transporter n=1 Tax=Aquabacterium sp. TaxID=1872578 RepID=UPI002BE2FF19|nr:AI-2E family transporter [Aquabacterium sp.]HSW08478.1 AI-2E family transporter [Aquabacterium sp.]
MPAGPSIAPALADDTPAPAPDRLPLHMPIDVRSAAIALIALLASLYTLHWAQAVFIPLLLSVMFSYALSPLVNRLQHWHVPRAIGAALLMVTVLGGVGAAVYSLSDDTTALVESLPGAAQKLRESLRSPRGAPSGAIAKVQQAASKLEQAAEESSSAPPLTNRGVTRVQVERPRFNIKDYLWSGTLGLVGFVGQALTVIFITYFLLASGDMFRRKMVKIAGPHFSRKKITIQLLDEITQQIQRYLLVQLLISALVGLATWGVCLAVGLERAAVWGVAAGVLNMVPYLGALATAGGLMLVSLMQFGTPSMALLLGGAALAIHIVSGQLLTPWLTGRACRMNPVVIFVGVLAWGWLWGVWGLLLGAPLLMALKAVCDRIDSLKPAGELLSA